MRVLKGLLGILMVVLVAQACGSDSKDACGSGQQTHHVCVSCGPVGGCGEYADQCSKTCAADADCADMAALHFCNEGVCQVGGCL